MKSINIVVLSLLILGCARHANDPQPPEQHARLEDILADQRMTDLEGKLSSLQARVSALESSDAVLGTEEVHYALAKTTAGPFIVVCRGVSPYLDGFKAHIFVGNITSATFVGAKLSVSWGKGYELYLENGPKRRQLSLTNTFSPGKYTAVDVSLTPATAEDVKTIRVSIALDEVQLREP